MRTNRAGINVCMLFIATVLISLPTVAKAATIPADGLTVWLDAGSLSLGDGASVSDWQSSGGTAYGAVQDNSGIQPTYVSSGINGQPSVRFAGTSGGGQTMRINNSSTTQGSYDSLGLTGGITIFAVTDSSTTYDARLWGDTNGLIELVVRTDKIFTGRNSSPDFDGTFNGPFAGPIIVAVTQTDLNANASNTLSAFVNGVAGTSGSQTNSSIAQGSERVNLGTDVTGPTGRKHYNGDLAELIVYDRVLSAAEMGQVTSYLGNKYAIVPEPTCFVLALFGMVGLLAGTRRRANR